MSITLTTIETIVRDLIGDISDSGSDIFTYNTSAVFTLTESNPITISEVSVNDVSSSVTYDYADGKITITSSLNSGDTVEITYTYYSNYSSTEIQSYIKASIAILSQKRVFTFTIEDSTIYPDPTDEEKNLIAVITSILINKPVNSYRLPDVTIQFSKTLSKDQLISKAICEWKKDSSGIFGIA